MKLDKEKPDGCNGKKKRNLDWTLATWNVRTMLQPGKMAEVAEQILKFRIDVVALQEIRWSGQGRVDKKEYSMFYSGAKKTGQRGTGFMITKKLRRSLLLFEPINERLCKIRLKGKFRNVTLLSAYAPTEESDEDEKVVFYQQLERAAQATPRYDTTIIMGDLNAQVGKEDFTRMVAGRNSLHATTNENGNYLCQFAEANNMIIKSTCFPHKDIHTATWKAPNGTTSQIDHVLIGKRHSSSIIDIKAARGPNCDSDHYMVKLKFRERLANVVQGELHKKKNWNLDKFKDPATLTEFKSKSNSKMEEELTREEDGRVEVEERIERNWNKIRNVIAVTADEIIGEKERRRGEEWFDAECQEAIRIKNEHRLNMLQRTTRLTTEEYHASRRRAKKIIRLKKREYQKKQIGDIEEMRVNNETRRFYGAIKYINRGFQPKTECCKDKHGKIVEGKSKVVDRWAEHFGELLGPNSEHNKEDELTTRICDALGNENDIEPPDMEDFLDAIEKLKNSKAPGEDSLVAEFFKNCGEIVIEQLYTMFLDIWETEKMPKQWRTSLVFPIYKKGDKFICTNYRGISLLSVAYKIFSNILAKKLNYYAENILQDYQCGFRQGKGTIDQIFVMRQLLEKCWEFKINLHVLFIDYRQAFDSINRSKLIEAMQEFQIPYKLIRLVTMTMHGSNARVLFNGNLSDVFPVTAGVRQGDALSATLFNLALHKVIKNLNVTGNILYSSTQICAYADDICIVARNTSALKETFTHLDKESKNLGLQVNENKTKYMCFGASHNTATFTVEGYTFEHVKSFTYLGSELNDENKIMNDVNKRVMAANRAYFANIRFFKSSNLSRATKVRIYKTLIRPILIYGAETWTLTAGVDNRLKIFERKILRRIYGPTYDSDNNHWRLRTNSEIYSLYEDTNVIQFIKARRIEWLGHVIRMPNNRMPSRLLHGTVIGTRRVGRPRRRWLQDVEADLRALGVTGWREKAKDRDEWSRIVREAKAHSGL